MLAGKAVKTVVVLAPSHCAAFEGASIPNATAYETPLGTIPNVLELANPETMNNLKEQGEKVLDGLKKAFGF